MLPHLPPDLLAALPLDARALGALACTCSALRDGVAAVWCQRGLTLRARHLPCLRDDRFVTLRSLRVHSGVFPGLLPRAFPHLRTLRLDRCRPVDETLWETLARAAPLLDQLVAGVQFEGPTYAATLRCLRRLLETLPSLWPRLTDLRLHGQGLVMWRTSPPPLPTRNGGCLDGGALVDALAAADEVAAMPPALLPAVTRLELTGRQFCPAVHAPRLVRARLEEPDGGSCWMAPRLTAPALTHLTWSTPAMGLPPLPTTTTRLDVDVRDIGTTAALASVLNSLPAALPPTLDHLRLGLDYLLLADREPGPRFDGRPLRALPRLRTLHLAVTFPPSSRQQQRQLVEGLLGAPPTVVEACVEAEHGPAFAARQWRDYLLRDEDADPEDESIKDLEAEIERIEAACAVPRDLLPPHVALRGGFVIV